MTHAPYFPFARRKARTRSLRAPWGAFLTALVVLGPAAGQPSASTRIMAPATPAVAATLEDTFRQADAQFQAANYAQAAVLFMQVWELSKLSENQERWGRYTAIFAFNAATSHRLDHNCEAAHTAFSQYLNAFSQLPPEQQQALRDATDLPLDNGTWLSELKDECPTSATTAVAPVETPVPAPVPERPVLLPAAKSDTAAAATGNWLLDVNVPTPAPVEQPPDTKGGSASSPLAWAMTVGGGASLAVSGYFLWSGLQNDKDATDPATKHQPYQDYTRARDRDYIAASILGGLGLGLASVGVYLLMSERSESVATQGITHPQLWLFSNGAHLGLAGQL